MAAKRTQRRRTYRKKRVINKRKTTRVNRKKSGRKRTYGRVYKGGSTGVRQSGEMIISTRGSRKSKSSKSSRKSKSSKSSSPPEITHLLTGVTCPITDMCGRDHVAESHFMLAVHNACESRNFQGLIRREGPVDRRKKGDCVIQLDGEGWDNFMSGLVEFLLDDKRSFITRDKSKDGTATATAILSPILEEAAESSAGPKFSLRDSVKVYVNEIIDGITMLWGSHLSHCRPPHDITIWRMKGKNKTLSRGVASDICKYLMKNLDSEEFKKIRQMWLDSPYNRTTSPEEAEEYDDLTKAKQPNTLRHSNDVQRQQMAIWDAAPKAPDAVFHGVERAAKQDIKRKLADLEDQRKRKIEGMNDDQLVDHIMSIAQRA